jgi:limonene-1,2-epoxide hydrolase
MIPGDGRTDNEEIVGRFLAGWRTDTRAAFERELADDVVWFNTGLPPARGKARCLEYFEVFARLGVACVDVECLRWATRGDDVFVERVDRVLSPDGAVRSTHEVAGVFTVREGHIVRWYDYFEPSPGLKELFP